MDAHPLVHGRPAIGTPGRAAAELRHRAPAVPPSTRPDVAMVELDHAPLRLQGVSARGVQHCLRAEPRQDSMGVVTVDDTVFTVVCDGVGEFRRSHVAADHVVETLLAALVDRRDVDTAVKQANEDLLELTDDGAGPLATTVLVAGTRALPNGWLTVDLWWVGDPYAWALLDGTWTWLNPAPATRSEFFSTATRALPATDLRVQRTSVSVRADAVFFMTDGVGTPLEQIPDVATSLATWWSEQPSLFDFARQVGFVRKSHMDDRTVVAIWPAPAQDDEEA